MSEDGETARSPEPENPLRARRRALLRAGLLVVLTGVLAVLCVNIDLTPNLSHVDLSILSGSERGHYYATVNTVARRARSQDGQIRNLATAGSIENLRRLMAPDCQADFGLVQDGLDWDAVDEEAYDTLELAARLPEPEMLLFLGREAEQIDDFEDLRGLRIGAGPDGSGTAVVMMHLFALPGFDRLDVELVHEPLARSVERTRRGELDLAAMVVFPDAPMISRAIRSQGLRVASFARAAAVAGHLDGVRHGTLPAGYFDAVRGLPSSDRSVLTVDTLLIAGPCARRSEIDAVLEMLSHELPGFIAHNRQVPPPAHLTNSEVAAEFYDNHGPPLIDQYLPWIVDVIPLSNVMTLVMAVSVLFNIMSFLNRFRLWRLDARRHRIEDELKTLFGARITRKEILLLDPTEVLKKDAERATLEALISRLAGLLGLCRRYATSVLVPMGQEMVYRYQENLILELIATLRRFQHKQEAATRGEPWEDL